MNTDEGFVAKEKKNLKKQISIHATVCRFNPFLNKPWFLRVCSASLLKTLWETKKLLVTISSFPTMFSNPYVQISVIFIKLKIDVCKLFQFGPIQNLSFGKGLNRKKSQLAGIK